MLTSRHVTSSRLRAARRRDAGAEGRHLVICLVWHLDPDHQQRAVAITEAALGPDHPDTATVIENFAATLDALGSTPTLEQYASASPPAPHLPRQYKTIKFVGHPAASSSQGLQAAPRWGQDSCKVVRQAADLLRCAVEGPAR